MTSLCLLVIFLGSVSQFVVGQTYPFQNINLSWDARVDDLVSRLTLEEIQNQMARGGGGEYGGPAPPIPRLGIGPYQWNTECVAGDSETMGNATSFTIPLAQSSIFSPSLIHEIAHAIGREVRGKHNYFVERGIFAQHTGATCFSPVINIVRDARWGRIEETYGEDPFLTGVLTESYVRGLQGNHSRYVQAASACKHFNVHGGPEAGRAWFDAKVTDADWRMTFLPAFKKCVKAGTFGLMCSYNSINGIPACSHKQLLTDILRTQWKFTGFVVSDQTAIENIVGTHHYANNSVDAAAAAINAGCNLDLSYNNPDNFYTSIVDAVQQGKLTEQVVRNSVKPLFYNRMRLGEFDPPDNNPYAKLNTSVVETLEHQALAVEAASKSFVLLKNQNNILPLKQGAFTKVAIIGPFADNSDAIFGGYHAHEDSSYRRTALQGLRDIYKTAKYGQVCEDKIDRVLCLQYNQTVTRSVVSGADLVFVLLGTGTPVEKEGRDRRNLELQKGQKQLLEDVLAYSGSAKIILLLFNAGPLNITFADESDRIDAIMECFYPAQATGHAIFNVLTNKGGNSSPAGRLSVTWPKYASQIPPIANYSMEGRTYRYLKTEPLYPFGYGLSYTNFTYGNIETIDLKDTKQNLNVTVTITNVGHVDSDEVIQCYVEWGNKSLPVPQRQLVYFNRLHLRAGQTIKHSFHILWENWAFWENDGWSIKAGSMTLYCGGQQPAQQKKVPSNVSSIQFVIPSSTHWDPD